jgi:hypothetical protein
MGGGGKPGGPRCQRARGGLHGKAKFRVLGFRFRVPGSGFGVPGSELRVPNHQITQSPDSSRPAPMPKTIEGEFFSYPAERRGSWGRRPYAQRHKFNVNRTLYRSSLNPGGRVGSGGYRARGVDRATAGGVGRDFPDFLDGPDCPFGRRLWSQRFPASRARAHKPVRGIFRNGAKHGMFNDYCKRPRHAGRPEPGPLGARRAAFVRTKAAAEFPRLP